jgi:hypothetical protein
MPDKHNVVKYALAATASRRWLPARPDHHHVDVVGDEVAEPLDIQVTC